jgi:hypothetical protein
MKDQNEKQYIFEMSRLDYEGQGKLEGKCFPSEKYFYSFDPDTDKMRICVPESDRKKVMMRMKKFKVKRFLVDCILPENEDEKDLEDAPEWSTSDSHTLHL